MRYATFAPVNLLMTISFVALGLFIVTGIYTKRKERLTQ